MAKQKAVIHFRSCGSSGNIYWILGAVREALRKQRRITEYNDLRDRVTSSGSYTEALAEIRKVVDLVDEDGVY